MQDIDCEEVIRVFIKKNLFVKRKHIFVVSVKPAYLKVHQRQKCNKNHTSEDTYSQPGRVQLLPGNQEVEMQSSSSWIHPVEVKTNQQLGRKNKIWESKGFFSKKQPHPDSHLEGKMPNDIIGTLASLIKPGLGFGQVFQNVWILVQFKDQMLQSLVTIATWGDGIFLLLLGPSVRCSQSQISLAWVPSFTGVSMTPPEGSLVAPGVQGVAPSVLDPLHALLLLWQSWSPERVSPLHPDPAAGLFCYTGKSVDYLPQAFSCLDVYLPTNPQQPTSIALPFINCILSGHS